MADALPVDIRHAAKIDRTRVARWAERVLAGERAAGGRPPLVHTAPARTHPARPCTPQPALAHPGPPVHTAARPRTPHARAHRALPVHTLCDVHEPVGAYRSRGGWRGTAARHGWAGAGPAAAP